jgi:hypothetical protein
METEERMSAKWILGTLLVVVVAVAILAGGFIAGRLTSPWGYGAPQSVYRSPGAFGGMMDSWGAWPGGMMGGGGRMGRWSGGPGGMMGGWRDGRGGMMGGYGGMMGAYGWGGAAAPDPLTVEQATSAVEDYLQTLGNEDLEIAEVMIFDNHAYVEVEDPALGIGAIELLVDPLSLAVFPEYGPSMMWNVEYGMMGSRGGMIPQRGMMGGWQGGMMGGYGGSFTPGAFDPDALSITPEEAVEIATNYLAQSLPDLQVDEHAELFPGYYTLHTLEDGEVVGMLSVNGYTGAVWPHTWHGDLVELSEIAE